MAMTAAGNAYAGARALGVASCIPGFPRIWVQAFPEAVFATEGYESLTQSTRLSPLGETRDS
jgi:hypothetical protein